MQLLVRGEVAALPLKGVIDFAAERARLDKEMAKAEADIKRVDAKLGNADFVARAPEEVVEGEREKREEAEDRRAQDRRGAGAAQGRGVSPRRPSTGTAVPARCCAGRLATTRGPQGLVRALLRARSRHVVAGMR